jgi:hypothetical protein
MTHLVASLVLTWGRYLVLAVALIAGASSVAQAQTVSWQGLDWTNTYPSNTIAISGDALLVSTGDASVGHYGSAFHALPAAIASAPEAWVEGTFFDTGATPGPHITALLFAPDGSVYLASLGAFGDSQEYFAHWRRDAPTPDQSMRGTDSPVGPRSAGLHTVAIGRRFDGRIEFWLDRKLVETTTVGTFPASFNYVYLAALGTSQGQTATFTAYGEGATPAFGITPGLTSYSSREAWAAAASALTTADFDGIAPAGGFTLYDTRDGLLLGGARFTGATPLRGPSGPVLSYLRIVDPAYGPAFYDWGSGAVLHGPPIPVGPAGEGGPNSHVRIKPPPGTTAVALDLMSFLEYASRFTVIVATTTGTRFFALTSASYPNRLPFGITSTSPIVSLDVYPLDGFPVLDNVAFGRANASPAPCTATLSASGQSFTAAQNSGSFDVTAPSTCGWEAMTDESWITLLPGSNCQRVGDVVRCPRGNGRVSYSVSANSSTTTRAGTITVLGQRYVVTQGGLSCTFTVAPTTDVVERDGGYARFTVTAPAGCAVTASSQASWLTIFSITPGETGAVVRVRAAANTGAPRTGTVLIAGQTVTVKQGIDACGAVDVTSEVSVTRSGLTPVSFGGTNSLTQTLRVTNSTSRSIRGPLFAVLVGMPNGRPYPYGAFLQGSQGMTTCFSSGGDYLLLLTAVDLPSQRNTGYQMLWVRQSAFAPISYTVKILSGFPSR